MKQNLPVPGLFEQLEGLGCVQKTDMCHTDDGFWALKKPLADLMVQRGILSVPDREGGRMECRLFFDDWYLYAVPGGGGFVCGLFKMREQEQDAKMGRVADGDIPGVTVSFVALQGEILTDCLREPAEEKDFALGQEINRVVAFGGQRHHPALKAYFLPAEAQGAYLIAGLYTDYIASLAEEGRLPVPELYEALYEKEGLRGRLPRFIEQNNRAAGTLVCDHRTIYFSDPLCPSEEERLAILATHTGNVSLFSFAAEVQFHARFLTRWARIPLPVIGRSAYASAIRADMSIGDAEFTGPTPYYRSGSRLVKKQKACHAGRGS